MIKFLNFYLKKNMIKDIVNCSYCGIQMNLKTTEDNKLGKKWRCMNSACEKTLTKKSLFIGSFFAHFKLDIRKVLKIIFYLSMDTILIDIEKFLEVKYDTIAKIKKKVQVRINRYFVANPIKLRGTGVNVQIGEIKLNFNVKYHRGRAPVSPVWALTITDVSTVPAKVFAKVVSKRDSATLLPVICDVVRPGSSICTDQ